MTEQTLRSSDWNGRNGHQWLLHQARLDAMLAPFGSAAIAAAALMPDMHVLDIGCGAGDSTLAIADQVGENGTALGIDISQALIGRARERAEATGSRARFDLSDAAQASFPAAMFDCLFSRFGVMFFDDPVAAFPHLRPTLKPDGQLLFACWRSAGDNDWVRLPMRAIAEIVSPTPPPPPHAPGPFSFGDPARITDVLSAAGFNDIVITPFDHDILFGETVAAAVQRALDVGPLERALAGQPDTVRARAIMAVGNAFDARRTDRGVVINGAAWIVAARPVAH